MTFTSPRENATHVVKIQTQNGAGRIVTSYFKPGWSDNNLPHVGSKAKTLVMTKESAETIARNVTERIRQTPQYIGRLGNSKKIIAIWAEQLVPTAEQMLTPDDPRIGQLCRNGKSIFYATKPNGIYMEHADYSALLSELNGRG